MSSTNPEKVVARGKIFELVEQPQPDGRTFELARRAPGVRVIIPNLETGKILLTKEFRHELRGWDYRLPGGKVFDTLAEYDSFRKSGRSLLEAATKKAIAESSEEAGIDVESVKLFKISNLGATIEWDLYVFQATTWQPHPNGQHLEQGEQIETGTWICFSDARTMVLDGDIQEDRIALILLRWLEQQSEER